MTGPGGQRFDRSTIATPYAIYYANSSFIRPKGNEPIRDMVEAFGSVSVTISRRSLVAPLLKLIASSLSLFSAIAQ